MYKVIGSRLPIHDAVGKVTGEIEYTGDIKLSNMAYGKLVLSTIPHGQVINIDKTEALAVEGVLGVLTYEDFPSTKYNSALRFKDHNIIKSETVLSQEVRFVGDRVAVVVAETLKAAEIAAKLVKVTYKEYPAVFDEEEALKEGAPILHEGLMHGNNVLTINAGASEEALEKGFAEADLIFEDKVKIPMVSQAPMETHTVIGDYKTGKMTIYTSTQNSFAVRVLASDVFEMPLNKVRIIQPTLGGSFGSKLELVTELVAGGASKHFRRPVKIVLSRLENMVASRTRNGATMFMKSGVKKDGTLTAIDFKIYTNTGGYVGSAANVIGAMSHKVLKLYKAPVHYNGTAVVTNQPIAGAMRGYGSPQAFYGLQTHLDRVIRELGMDSVEFFLKNIYDKDDVDRASFGKPEALAAIERAAEIFNWKEKKKEAEESQKAGGAIVRGVGIGIGCHGNGVFGAHHDTINLTLRLNEDGTFNYWSASHDMGNGSLTAQTMIMAEVLSIDPRIIEPTRVDTETCPWNLGDYASRGVFVEGYGALKIAEQIKGRILDVASKMYETDKEKITIEDSKIVVAGKALGTLGDVALYAQVNKMGELIVTQAHESFAGRTSYGAHLAQVEVNKETGDVKVLDYVAVHDVGRVINRLGVEGQLEGGIQMGIGYALREKMTFDSVTGQLKENNLKKYQMYKAHEMPSITLDFIETEDEGGPFGAKSISECAVTPVAPAIINGVNHALGKQMTQFPITKEEIMG